MVAPILPLVWIAIWAWRAAQKKKQAATSAPPPQATEITWRACVLFLVHAFLYVWLAGLLGASSEHVLETWLTAHGDWLRAAGIDALVLAFVPLTTTFVAPAVLLIVGPRWLVWRVLRPLRLRRTLRAALWLTPFLRRADVDGLARLVDASLGRPVIPPPPDVEGWRLKLMPRLRPKPLATRVLRADAWSACARAIEAELQGDAARAELLATSFDAPPRLVRRVAFEFLAVRAAERGDWDAVERYARLGRGRGVRLWRLLARARRAPGVLPARLWLAWLLAPERRRSLPYVRATLRPAAPHAVAVAPVAIIAGSGAAPWTAHLDLLRHASLGTALDGAAVVALLAQWNARLGPEAEAVFRARAIELGVTDGAEMWQRLRAGVVSELELLLAAASVSATALDAHGTLGEILGRRLRERLFVALQPFLQDEGREADELGTPLEEWERWLQMRDATQHLERHGGANALQTAWLTGLRDTAWNRPCRVFNTYGTDAARTCQTMFTWATELGRRLGDDECARVNASNALIAAKAAR